MQYSLSHKAIKVNTLTGFLFFQCLDDGVTLIGFFLQLWPQEDAMNNQTSYHTVSLLSTGVRKESFLSFSPANAAAQLPLSLRCPLHHQAMAFDKGSRRLDHITTDLIFA